MQEIRKLLFRSCKAADGRRFAFLTEQPEIEELFDSGYKVAYKAATKEHQPEKLGEWLEEFTVTTKEVPLLQEAQHIPDALQTAFDSLASALLKGIDVFFCDYNFGVTGDTAMCQKMMEQHTSTDFVLFSCNSIVGDNPITQPYMVSYSVPRYQTGQKIARQHRIYSRTDGFAFSQAINAIITQRTRDDLLGGHIRNEVDHYIKENIADQSVAQRELDNFSLILTNTVNDQKSLPSSLPA